MHAPRTLAELESEYDLGMGDLTLDLSALDFGQESREVTVNVGVGELLVLVGSSTPVEVESNVRIGDSRVLRRERRRGTSPPDAPGKLTLKLNVGIGDLEVRRVR